MEQPQAQGHPQAQTRWGSRLCRVIPWVVAAALFVASSPAQPEQVVRVGIYDNNPMVFLSTEGTPQGIYIDILQQIATSEKWRLDYVFGVWSDCLARLQAGEIDLLVAMAYTPTRSEIYAFSEESVFTNWGQVYAGVTTGISSFLDLRGRTLALVRGDVYAETLLSTLQSFEIEINQVEVADYSAVLASIAAGQADAGAVSRLYGQLHAGALDVSDTGVVFNPVQLCFAGTWGTSEELLGAIDRHLRLMKADPSSVYHKSLNRWLQGAEVHEVLPYWVVVTLACIGTALLLASFAAGSMGIRVRRRSTQIRYEVQRRGSAESSLERSEKTARMLIDTASDPIYTTDLDGHFTYANPSALALFGYSADEVTSLSFMDLVDREYQPVVQRQIVAKMEDPALSTKYEVLVHTSDGRDIWLELHTHLLQLNAHSKAILGVARDVSDRKSATSQLRRMLDGTIEVAARVAALRDPYTAGHSQRVSTLAHAIAKDLGLTPDRIEGLCAAAQLHDVGKAGIPLDILSRPGKLTVSEVSLIREHPTLGFNLFRNVAFPWPVPEIILQHHERMNGSGYPAGLRGDDILLEARIIGVADVVEAMTAHRPYRPALGLEQALDEILSERGTLYDSAVVDACVRLFKEERFTFREGDS